MSGASYAMAWRAGTGPRRAGRVVIDEQHLDLDSTSPTAASQQISLDDVEGVVVDHGTLRVDVAGLPTLRLSSLDGPGALRELADRIAAAMDSRR